MSVSHILTLQYNDGASIVAKSETFSYGGAIVIDESIPSNQTDLLVTFSFTRSKLKLIWILADVAMTLETNSSSSPQDTITLVANEPFLWSEKLNGVAVSEVFGGDVTALYVTNTTAGTLQIRGLYDPT